MDDIQETLLMASLEVAVPLWVDKIKSASPNYIQNRARELSQFIAEHGDDILFRSKKKGGTAQAFNALAEGLACMAFVPGGVRFKGMYWAVVAGELTTATSRQQQSRERAAAKKRGVVRRKRQAIAKRARRST